MKFWLWWFLVYAKAVGFGVLIGCVIWGDRR